MNLIGNWKGYYEFGEGYALPHFGARVVIEVSLTGSKVSFTGIMEEKESEFAVPLKSTIKGFSENGMLSFVKTYPKYPRIKEQGSSELVFENGILEIEHLGFVDEKFNALYGGWSLREEFEVDGHIEEDILYGTWLLKKIRN